jgi:putative transposase
MPREARLVQAGVPVHITQRGNNKQQVFHDSSDFATFMSNLIKSTSKYGVVIHGLCLMDNHYHIACTPIEDDSLALAFGRTNWAYATAHNAKYEKSGHLWQERFNHSFLIGNHFIRAMRYIEMNPVKAGIVQRAYEWPWSTARANCGIDPIPDWLCQPAWFRHNSSPQIWKKMLNKAASNLHETYNPPIPRKYRTA